MNRLLLAIGFLAILTGSADALAAGSDASIVKLVKENITQGAYKPLTVNGYKYIVTMLSSDGEQTLIVAQQKADVVNIVTITKMPEVGADDASYSVEDNKVSITYGYAHSGFYETTLTFELSKLEYSEKFSSLLISYKSLSVAHGSYCKNGDNPCTWWHVQSTELIEYDFYNHFLRLWWKKWRWPDVPDTDPGPMDICRNSSNAIEFYEKNHTFPCRPRETVKLPNSTKVGLDSIDIEKFSHWASFVATIIEMNSRHK